MRTVDTDGMQMFLSFSDVFDGKELPNLEREIKSFNMHKAISIIVELISIRNKKYSPHKFLGMEIEPSFQSVLKRFIMDGVVADEVINEICLKEDLCIVALQPMLLLLKRFIIQGDYNSLAEIDYIITEDDYKKIIELELVIIEELNNKHSESLDTDHFLYSTYHLNYTKNLACEYSRMYYMMNLSKDDSFLTSENKNEFRDYYNDYLRKYGFSPLDYLFLLFIENRLYYRELHDETFLYTSLWKSLYNIYKDENNQSLYEKIIKSISKPVLEYKEWAEESTEFEWDFSKFFEFPLIIDDNNNYISISDITISNAFYEKLYWMIRDCYPQDDSRAMAFFGRLFENYIQTLTEESTKADDYEYIKEFSYQLGRNTIFSSDAYIRKGNNLLAVEAKGFSVLQICMTRNQRIDDNNEKLFIKPVLQADRFLNETICTHPDFSGVENVYIISVTMENINAVPNYYDTIHKTINQKKICSKTKYYFNLSVEEYEQLMFVLEDGNDIFTLLKSYYEDSTLTPLSTYIQRDFSNIDIPSFTKKHYSEATKKLKQMIFHK